MAARYDKIGAGYDSTRRADPAIVERLRYHLRATPSGRYLDLACGTGNYTAALQQLGAAMHGLDQSERMLAIAREKEADAWTLADAAALPFGDGVFAGAICTLAVHHFSNVAAAFAEIWRVLAGGRFVLFTQDHVQTRGAWLSEYFPMIIERAVAQMPSAAELRRQLIGAGFRAVHDEPFEVTPSLRDLFLYSGKQRPSLYLDARVRSGISAFALAEPYEVERGCARLAADIDSGRIDAVMDAYRHPYGDYLFLIAER